MVKRQKQINSRGSD